MANRVKEARADHIKSLQSGNGQTFTLQNHGRHTLTLPKPSLDQPPKYTINPGEFFKGDTYHISQLGNLVRVVEQTPEPKSVESVSIDDTVEQFDPATRTIRRVPRSSLEPVAPAPATPPVPAKAKGENRAAARTAATAMAPKDSTEDPLGSDLEPDDAK